MAARSWRAANWLLAATTAFALFWYFLAIRGATEFALFAAWIEGGIIALAGLCVSAALIWRAFMTGTQPTVARVLLAIAVGVATVGLLAQLWYVAV